MLKRRLSPAGFIEPCIPILAAKPPAGPHWAHEIKHDGYRLIVRRDGERARLFTRRGYDWTERFPAIAAATLKLRASTFTLDGEAVVVGPDGRQFLMRGIDKVRAEWAIVCTVHNLLKLAHRRTLSAAWPLAAAAG